MAAVGLSSWGRSPWLLHGGYAVCPAPSQAWRLPSSSSSGIADLLPLYLGPKGPTSVCLAQPLAAASSFEGVRLIIGKTGDSETKVRIGRATGQYHISLKFAFLAFLYFTVPWETKSQLAETTAIYTGYPFPSGGLSLPSTKINRTFSPLPRASNVFSHRSMHQQARKSAGRP